MDPSSIPVRSVEEFKEFADRRYWRLEAARGSVYICSIYSACLFCLRMLGYRFSETLMIFGVLAGVCAYVVYCFYKDKIKGWLMFHQNMYKTLKFSFIEESVTCPKKVYDNERDFGTFRRHSYLLKHRVSNSSTPIDVKIADMQQFLQEVKDAALQLKLLNENLKETILELGVMKQNLKSIVKNLMDFDDNIKFLEKFNSCREVKLKNNTPEHELNELIFKPESAVKSQDVDGLAVARNDCMETGPSALCEGGDMKIEQSEILDDAQESVKLYADLRHFNKISCSEGDLSVSDNTRSATASGRSSGGSSGLLIKATGTDETSPSRNRFQEAVSMSQQKTGRFWKSFRNAVRLWPPRIRYSVPRPHVNKKYSSLTLLRD